MKKTLLVLTQGTKVDIPGHEHFLAEGIANFMGSTREARIVNVIGGSSGDAAIFRQCHQFYGRLKEHSKSKILDGEAVCALIPTLRDVSIGLDVDATTRIGRQLTFHFDREKEPLFKYVRRIGNEDADAKYNRIISENETKLSKEKRAPLAAQQVGYVGYYGLAFPFGNYTTVGTIRTVGESLELMRPVRSYTPEMPGYVVIGDHEKVQKGARRVYDMLRSDQGFGKNDATILVSCINRRIVELTAGGKSGTEAEILREGLSSTQVLGFLAYGELGFTHLIQEPYFYAFACWGITFHSEAATTKPKEKKKALGIKGWIKGPAEE